MSLTLPEPTATNPSDASYNDGYVDGELAAVTLLPSRRAHARASMAEQYDPLYAQGYTDGFMHQTAVNAALNEKNGPVTR